MYYVIFIGEKTKAEDTEQVNATCGISCENFVF